MQNIMSWTVTIPKKAAKNLSFLPKRVRKSLVLLMREIETDGPG